MFFTDFFYDIHFNRYRLCPVPNWAEILLVKALLLVQGFVSRTEMSL